MFSVVRYFLTPPLRRLRFAGVPPPACRQRERLPVAEDFRWQPRYLPPGRSRRVSLRWLLRRFFRAVFFATPRLQIFAEGRCRFVCRDASFDAVSPEADFHSYTLIFIDFLPRRWPFRHVCLIFRSAAAGFFDAASLQDAASAMPPPPLRRRFADVFLRADAAAARRRHYVDD
jgi:hypothetical protein